MLAIRGGRPEMLALRDIIEAFVTFREEVITRRTKFELNKARDRAHILLGLVIAVTNLDEVVRIIRGSPNPAAARAALLAREWPVGEIAPYIRLVEAIEADDADVDGKAAPTACRKSQVKAILDLRLHRLTALGRDEIGGELQGLAAAIAEFLSILADRVKLYGVMREELVGGARCLRHAAPLRNRRRLRRDRGRGPDRARRHGRHRHHGRLHQAHPALDLPRARPRRQGPRRAWRPRTRTSSPRCSSPRTHNPVLFFSTAGKVYRLKVWRLPEGGPATRGRPIVNLLPALDQGETIATVLPLPEDEAEWGKLHVVFATAKGNVRRNAMDAFANVPSNGKFAMRFEEDQRRPADRRRAARAPATTCCSPPAQGKAIRFAGDDVREFQSRTSTGVRGMTLEGRRRGDLAVDPPPRRHDLGRARGLCPLRAVEGREGRRTADERRALRGNARRASSSS